MNVRKNVIWKDPRCDEDCKEASAGFSPLDEPAGKISADLGEMIASILVSYDAKDVVKKLIYNAIHEQVKQYIREYDNVVATDMLQSMKGGWSLGEIKDWKSEVSFSNARHAKLYDFTKEVANEFKKRTNPNELVSVVKEMTVNETNQLDNNDGLVYVSDVVKLINKFFNGPVETDKQTETDEQTQIKQPPPEVYGQPESD